MKKYEYIIIGFGKGGKTLAGFLGNLGKKVALIEKSNKMYGGTCINIGCIPTKTLVSKAKNSLIKNHSNFEDKAVEYKRAVKDKENLIEMLSSTN